MPTRASPAGSTTSSARSTDCRWRSTTRSSTSPRARPPDPHAPARGAGRCCRKSGVTRLIDRLVAEGLVERERVLDRRPRRGGGPDRRRAVRGCARRRGRTCAGIADHFLDVLDRPARAGRAWARASRSVRPTGPSTCRLRVGPGRPETPTPAVTGRVYTGTSGFAYPGWAPRFYPAGLAADGAPPRITPRGSPVRAEQHVLPAAQARAKVARGSGRRPRTSGSRQGPARRDLPRPVRRPGDEPSPG